MPDGMMTVLETVADSSRIVFLGTQLLHPIPDVDLRRVT